MAEIVALIGTGAAIIQLSEYGIRFSKLVLKCSKNHKAARESLGSLANRVRQFSNEIGVAQLVLDGRLKQTTGTPVTHYMAERNIVADIAQRSSAIKRELQKAKKDIKLMDDGLFSKVRATRKLARMKPAIAEVLLHMEGVKTSVILLMTTLHMEAASLEAERSGGHEAMGKLDQEIRFLKDLVRSQIRTIEYQREELRRARAVQEELGAPSESWISIDATQQDALLDLSRSLCEYGVVPGSTPPASTPDNGKSLDEDMSTDAGLSRSHEESSGSTSSLELEEEPKKANATAPPAEQTIASALPAEEIEEQTKPAEPIEDESESDSSSSADPPAAVRILRLDVASINQQREGYIPTVLPSGSLCPVTAAIATSLDGNIISSGRARKLGLEIRKRARQEKVILEVMPGKQDRSIGTVEMKWIEGVYPRLRPPITVVCEVFEYNRPLLVFGRHFGRGKMKSNDIEEEHTQGKVKEEDQVGGSSVRPDREEKSEEKIPPASASASSDA